MIPKQTGVLHDQSNWFPEMKYVAPSSFLPSREALASPRNTSIPFIHAPISQHNTNKKPAFLTVARIHNVRSPTPSQNVPNPRPQHLHLPIPDSCRDSASSRRCAAAPCGSEVYTVRWEVWGLRVIICDQLMASLLRTRNRHLFMLILRSWRREDPCISVFWTFGFIPSPQ